MAKATPRYVNKVVSERDGVQLYLTHNECRALSEVLARVATERNLEYGQSYGHFLIDKIIAAFKLTGYDFNDVGVTGYIFFNSEFKEEN